MKYQCIICNYISTDYGNFSRHEKTKKHMNNVRGKTNVVNKISKKSETEEHLKTNIFRCKFCDTEFRHRQSLKKHEINRCKQRNNNIYSNIDYIRTKLVETEYKLKIEMEERKKLEDETIKITEEKSKLLDIIDTYVDTNNQSVNVINCLTKKLKSSFLTELLEENQLNGLLSFNKNINN